MNNAELTPSLWIYGIHSNNPDLIHLLEQNQIEPEYNSYNICLNESIKCHHNNIALYIMNNYLTNDEIENSNNTYTCFQSYNFDFMPSDFNMSKSYYACKYNYIDIVKLIFNIYDTIDINKQFIIIKL